MKIRNIFVGVPLLALAGSSFALSLGGVRGNAVLGQALSLAFELKLESGEDVDAGCLRAQLTQGDTRVDGSRVTLAISGSAGERLVRLRSSVPVDEPVVTVTLTANCDQQVSHRYVLLTELPQDPRAAASVSASSAMASSAPVQLPKVSEAVAIPAQMAPSEVRGPRSTMAGKGGAERTARHEASKTASAKQAAAPQSAKARLKLDSPVDSVERVVGLKSSPMLSVVPQEGASPQRTQALAAWASLNRSLEQILSDTDDRARLEAENKRLKSVDKQAQAQLNELKTRLAEAEDERYANPVVYGLGGLVLLLLGAGAYAGLRLKRGGGIPRVNGAAVKASRKGKAPWWQTGLKSNQEPEVGASILPEPAPVTAGQAPAVKAANAVMADSAKPAFLPSMSGVHVDLDLSESAFQRLESMGKVTTASPTDFLKSDLRPDSTADLAGVPVPGGGSKPPLDLFDVQQHAEFFVSLGQYDEAIGVLQAYLDQYPESTPLAYLDLLKIHHTLSHTGEYARLRERFNQIFSAEVPPFSAFSKAGKGLEAYPRTLSYLEKVWGSPGALVAVEDAVFHAHAVSIGEFFDLDAFKDLLVLQAVARQLDQEARSNGASGASSPRLQAGDLSTAFQTVRDSQFSATPGQIPAEFMPVEPISGFGPSTQAAGSDSLMNLDLDLSDMEAALLSPRGPTEVRVEEPPGKLGSAVAQAAELRSPLDSPFDSPLDSPLDAPLDFTLDGTGLSDLDRLPAAMPVEATTIEDSNLIDFDLFEADLAKSMSKSDKL